MVSIVLSEGYPGSILLPGMPWPIVSCSSIFQDPPRRTSWAFNVKLILWHDSYFVLLCPVLFRFFVFCLTRAMMALSQRGEGRAIFLVGVYKHASEGNRREVDVRAEQGIYNEKRSGV